MSQYNDIKITPNIGVSSDPKIEFIGAGNSTITLKVLDTVDGGITFEGQKGELLSLVDADVSFGSSVASFSVNDFYGVPQIQSYNDGRVLVAPYGAQTVGIGTTNPQAKLDVNGTVLLGSLQISSGIITSSNPGVTTVVYYGDGSKLTNVFATYTTNAGVSTYAVNSGIATNVIGGISSVTSLNVSGVTTLGTVRISSGIVTATSGIVTYYGDGSKLQGVVAFNVVTQPNNSNPVYPTLASGIGVNSVGISTNNLVFTESPARLGIGTTNPISTLDVRGDIKVGIDTSQGLILTSPNGTTFRLVVDNSGNLSAISTTL